MPAAVSPGTPVVQRPLAASYPKPTLWQRIWYGANAERKLATQQVPLADSLSEVKAGVLAEMQSMARTKGGVSGSPFANVMLPQPAKAAPVAAPAPRRRRGGWLVLLLALVAFGWVLLQIVTWRTLPLPTAGVAPTVPATQPTAPVLAPFPATQPAAARPVDLLAAPRLTVGRQTLAKVVQTVALTTAPVANGTGQLVLTATVANTDIQPLQQLQLELRVDDQADVPLLRRVLTVAAVPAQGQATQRFVLDLLPAQPEHLVATVPLRALKARLVPLQAEAVPQD
jgi:hypothetical protein